MTRDEMLLRHGYYAGLASRELHDESYAERWRGRAQDMTEEDFFREAQEIQERLAAAGVVAVDEDPFESDGFMQKLLRGIEDGVI